MGFAVDDEEEGIGARCIGAAVLDDSGRPAAAISVTGTVAQITPEALPLLAEEVSSAARSIAEAIRTVHGKSER